MSMKIVFMGTPDFAVHTLSALCDAGYDVTGVVTQPDRPRGRRMEITPGPVAAEAIRRGLDLYQPAKIRNNPEALERIRLMAPDLIAVAAFGQIIPPEILELPPLGCFNVHASLLPAYRGAAPIQHAILDGCPETGVTIMRMDAGLDTGDIVSRCVIPITPEETGGSLFDKLAAEGAALLIDTLPSIEDGTASFEAQPEKSTTPYAAMIRKEDGRIDWSEDACVIERKVRAMNPWPSAFTTLDGKTLKIWSAHVEKSGLKAGDGEAGVIVRQDARGLYIQTGQGILVPDELQMEGRRRMSAREFLRGYCVRSPKLGGHDQ